MNRQSVPRLAGVRLTRNGPVMLIDAGSHRLGVGEGALVELAGQPGEYPATVAVTPDQLVSAGGAKPQGRVTGRAAPTGDAQGPGREEAGAGPD